MNNTPLFTSLKNTASKNAIRFHMPGHVGKKPFCQLDDMYAIDYTEIYETGNLYSGEGPIALAEQKAAEYFGAKECYFLTGGSTLGILSSLMVACGNKGEIIVDRNCHKAVSNGIALLDITPYFVFPNMLNPFGFTSVIDPLDIETCILENPNATSVLITSPNYYGICQDIASISEICRKYNKILIVDEAHGAHFPAVGVKNAIAQGADLSIVSAHKTMPALGQCAFLLSNGKCQDIRRAMSTFGTSSPSYLLMSSLDVAREYMQSNLDYTKTAQLVQKLRNDITAKTAFTALDTCHFDALDPCRLTISTFGTNLSGDALADILYYDYNIAVEMSNALNIVLIITCMHDESELTLLLDALMSIETSPSPILQDISLPNSIQRVMRVRDAFFSSCNAVEIEKSAGEICARPIVPYPPGVPIVYPGEIITQLHIEFLTNICYNSIDKIYAVSKN